jgi:hypothetical protein
LDVRRGIWRPSSCRETSLGAPARWLWSNGRQEATNPRSSADLHSEPSKGFRRRIGFDSLSDFDRWCAGELAIYGSRRTAVVPGDRRTIGAWPNRGSVPSGVDVLSIPCRGWMPTLLPAHGHQHSPTCNADTPHRRRPDQLQVPAPSATDRALCSLSRSPMWLAVFKMMHRFGGRQGYVELLTALAGLTDRNGPPRISPRPFGHP